MRESTLEHRHQDRSSWRPIIWRGLAFLTAYLVGFAGLLAGATVSERALVGAGPLELAYYALGLFVLGGLDIGTPAGGPEFAQALLWAGYFLAPLVTASVIIEAAVRLISPLALRVRPLKNHIVLGGAGRLSLLYIRKLRESDPRRTVVVVERDPNHPALAELRDIYRVLIVSGDVTHDAVLRRLRLGRARRVLLLTGDDFTNLDAAAKIMKLAPELASRVVVHVSDLGFMRETAESSVARACEVFNGHEFAATHLVREHLLARFKETPNRDPVVLAGFGRFGQTVLNQLQIHARGRFGPVVLVDDHATKNAGAFHHQTGFSDDYDRVVIDGDILDPAIWQRIGDEATADGFEPVIVLGSGNDGTNLHAAFIVIKQRPAAYVVVRSFRPSPFTAEITTDAGVHAFSLAELIQNGLPQSWF